MGSMIWKMRLMMRDFYHFLPDFFWVCVAYFKGKVLQQKDYQFHVHGSFVDVPAIKTSGKRIKLLARWNGYIILDAGGLRWMLNEEPRGDCTAFLAEEWQEHRSWPKIGEFTEGEGTHGEAYRAKPPHFLVAKR